MHRLLPLRLAVFAGALLLALPGCSILPEPQTDPTRFFVLTEPAPNATEATRPHALVIGLLPLEVPSYLADSRAMAVLDAGHQVTYRDFDRWAEPLDHGMTRVLRGALANTDPIQRVLVPPFPLQPARAYDLQVRIIDAAPATDGSLHLTLRYALVSPDGKQVLEGNYDHPGGRWDGSPADFARGLGEALQQAAVAIARRLD